jgi:opacity protein-like surface antigen
MRTIRTLTAGLACVLLPAVAAAQAAPQSVPNKARTFTDSWYWGAKGGISMFGSAAEDISAPSVGAEWMITRTRIAMYVSVEQSFFDTQGAVFDPTSAGGARIVDIKDSRRYNLQLFAFPKQYGSFRPYAGLGFALISIRDAQPTGTFSSAGSQDTVFARVNDESSRTTPVFTLGGQYDVQRFALFVQASTMATRNRFLINGKANTYLIEGGLRYNLVDAIEKLY